MIATNYLNRRIKPTHAKVVYIECTLERGKYPVHAGVTNKQISQTFTDVVANVYVHTYP